MTTLNKIVKQAGNFFIKIRPLYLLLLALMCGILSIYALRSNNEHMLLLRNDVYQADKNNGNVQLALDNLQSYVIRHMNTNLSTGNGSVYPPIQLEYTYLHLVKAQEAANQNSNIGLYTAAEYYCQQQDPKDFSGRNRVPCIEQYVTSHGSKLPKIPASLYEFDFQTPSWSPDLAGWSLLATICLFIVTGFSYTLRFAEKYL